MSFSGGIQVSVVIGVIPKIRGNMLILLLSLSTVAPASYHCKQYEASTIWGKIYIRTESRYLVWDGELISDEQTFVSGAVETSCTERVAARHACGYLIWNLSAKPCQN